MDKRQISPATTTAILTSSPLASMLPRSGSVAATAQKFTRSQSTTAFENAPLHIGFALQTPNHVHTILRDPANDYGTDWLRLHYEEHTARR